jgi:hypothetical protein
VLGEQEIAYFLALLRIAHHYRHNVHLTGRQTCRIEDGLYPRPAFLMAVALPLRSLEVPDRRGSGGADRPLLNRPLAVTFSSLLDCSKADLKVGEMHYSSHYAASAGDRIMVDQEVIGSQLKRDRFPFQSEGDITLAVRNANYTLGPVMLHIDMKPGAVIPAHEARPRHCMLWRARLHQREQAVPGRLRCISRQAGNTARTPLRTGASCSSFGQNALPMRRQISLTS